MVMKVRQVWIYKGYIAYFNQINRVYLEYGQNTLLDLKGGNFFLWQDMLVYFHVTDSYLDGSRQILISRVNAVQNLSNCVEYIECFLSLQSRTTTICKC